MNIAVLFYLVPFFVLMVLSKGGDGIESFVASEFGVGTGPAHFISSLLLMQPTIALLLSRKALAKIWIPFGLANVLMK